MFIDTYNVHFQFISKPDTYRGQLEKITLIITSIAFAPSYPSHFLTSQSGSITWKGIPFQINYMTYLFHYAFLVNGTEYLSQAATPWKCTCPRQGCWCPGYEFTSWERFTVEAKVYLIQPRGRKTGWSSFSPCPFTQECDLCKSFGWTNREVSALNQLYYKSTVCLCFSTLIPRARSILLQVECIHRVNILKVSRRVLYFPRQEPSSWFRKRHSTHSEQ